MIASLILEVTRKEMYEQIKTWRYIIISALYGFAFISSAWLISSYGNFVETIYNSHTIFSIFYPLIPIVLSYDLVSKERSNKSIYLLLSKPISREEVLLGKFLGTLLSIFMIFLPIISIAILLLSIKLGSISVDDLYMTYFHLIILILVSSCYVSISLISSVISKSSSMSIVLSIIVGLLGLNALYPLFMIYGISLGSITQQYQLYIKIAYALSPYHNLNLATDIIFRSPDHHPIISLEQSIFALLIFLMVTLPLSLVIFKRKELV